MDDRHVQRARDVSRHPVSRCPAVDQRHAVAEQRSEVERRDSRKRRGRRQQRTPVELDDPAEVRRLQPESVGGRCDELRFLIDSQHRVGTPLIADRRPWRLAHRSAAAQRAPDVSREHLHVIGQIEDPLQRMEQLRRSLLRLDSEVRTRDISDEQRIARQHRARTGATAAVEDQIRRVLRAVARRRQRFDPDRAELDGLAVAERLVWVLQLLVSATRRSVRRWPRRVGRDRKRGRRGCGSQGCSGSRIRARQPAAGTRRSPTSGPRRRPRPRRRSHMRHSPGHRGGSGERTSGNPQCSSGSAALP